MQYIDHVSILVVDQYLSLVVIFFVLDSANVLSQNSESYINPKPKPRTNEIVLLSVWKGICK